MNLSQHFTLEELTSSDYAARHGLDNTPDDAALANLHDLAAGLEQVRELLNAPMRVNSAYRSPKVNSGIGGSKTSAHMRGLACDFTCPGFGDTKEVALAISASQINYDQLILEYGWVHIAFPGDGEPARRIDLTKRSATASYERGIA